MAHTELIAKLRKYKPQSGYAWNCYAAATAIERLENALRLVMDCAGDIQSAPVAELEAALSCGDPEAEKQANAWLVARAALLPDNAPLIGPQGPHRADCYRAGTTQGEK